MRKLQRREGDKRHFEKRYFSSNHIGKCLSLNSGLVPTVFHNKMHLSRCFRLFDKLYLLILFVLVAFRFSEVFPLQLLLTIIKYGKKERETMPTPATSCTN